MILVVDDEENIRHTLCRVLERGGYECCAVASVGEARTTLGEGRYELVLCDVRMPGESGVTLLRHLRSQHPGLPIVMVSGVSDPVFAAQALELGAFGYVAKPFEANQVLIEVANALRRAALEAENASYRDHLEGLVTERTTALEGAVRGLERADEQLRRSSEETIEALSQAIEGRDVETGQHIARMARYTALVARHAGLDAEHCDLLRLASPMHDVGKIAVPDGILFKPGRLSRAEFGVIQQHAEVGFGILSKSSHPLLNMAALIAHTHHERWDGDGYPRGLTGEGIPIEGRLTAIADVFDALVSRRVYKPPMPMDAALDIMREGRATHFDPDLIDVFFDHIDEIVTIRDEHADE